MAFPTVGETTVTVNTGSGAHVANEPATINTDDYLVLFALATTNITAVAGFTQLGNGDLASYFYDVWHRKATGSEGGGTIAITGPTAGDLGIYNLVRVEAGSWSEDTADIGISTIAEAGSGTTPNPTAVTPPNGAADNLAIAGAGIEEEDGFSSGPSGYSTVDSGEDGINSSGGTAWKEFTGATEDPGQFTHAGTGGAWGAWVISVAPAGGGGGAAGTGGGGHSAAIGELAIGEEPTTGTPATVTPAAIAVPITVPTPTVLAASTVTPAAIAVPATLPTPTVLAASVVTPLTIQAIATLPTPIPGIPATVTPAAIAVPATLPTPTILAASLVTPAAIAVPATLPTPVPSIPATVTPAVIPVPATLPTPTVLAASTVTPAAIPVPATLPTPAVQAASVVTPAAIPVTITLPTPAAGVGGIANPLVIDVPITLPTPQPSVPATVTPAAISVLTTLPTPIASIAATRTPAVIAIAITVPTPSPLGVGLVTPAAIVVNIAVPTPSIFGGALEIIARQFGQLQRLNDRLALSRVGRTLRQGYRLSEDWERVSDVFVFDEDEVTGTGHEELVMEAIAAAWAAHASDPAAVLLDAINTALDQFGFRRPDGTRLV